MPNAISRSELFNLHALLGNQARELMTLKNHDYAVETDVFRNFRAFGTLGVLVRLSDKLARLRSFEENETFAVTDEKLVDTILDILNYAVIYYAMKQEEQPEPPANVVAINAPVQGGPYCSFCERNLADFQDSDGCGGRASDGFWCSDCACNCEVDTSNMFVMGRL